jgi:hypothetical protein
MGTSELVRRCAYAALYDIWLLVFSLVDLSVMPGKKRVRVDLTASSMERNFITPVRAMADFLLKPSDLEGLRKTKRRSPYENEPPITVYWRKDVETK